MSVKKQVKSFPKYQIHKASKRAFIWWQGKRHYLGVANSAASIELYNQWIGEIAQTQGLCRDLLPSHVKVSEKVTVSLLMARYLIKIQKEISSKEIQNTKYSFRPLRKLFGHTPVDQFGPRALKQIQQEMVRDGLARKVINQRIGRIKRLFRYGVAEELVPPSVFQALQAVEGLRAGRTEAREIAPIEPISDDQMELLIPFLSDVTAAMVRLQRLTGMRPGEVCQMRAMDIDQSGEVWLYHPATHKTQWRGKSRVVPLGPKAQEILLPFLDRPEDAPFFFHGRVLLGTP